MITAGTMLLLVAGGLRPAASQANEVANGGFEEGTVEGASSWTAYGAGMALDREQVQTGQRALRCTGTSESGMGVRQTIHYEKPDRRPIIIGGWSRAEGIAGGGDYCIYLDIVFEDGTPWWGRRCDWQRGTHDWEYGVAIHRPPKPVREIQVFVFLRRTQGTAWFDGVFLAREGLYVTDFRVGSDYPRTATGIIVQGQLSAPSRWQMQLLGADGRALADASGDGVLIDFLRNLKAGDVPTSAHIAAEDRGGNRLVQTRPVSLRSRASNPVRKGYAIWAAPGSRKVYPTEPPPAEASDAYRIVLARNEHEGLQVAIRTADSTSLENVALTLGPFVSDAGRVLAPDSLSWSVVGHVRVSEPSGHPLASAEPTWCPEVLLPGRPIRVPGGRTQAFWVDVHASEDAAPGTYRGRIGLFNGDNELGALSLAIEVFPFALPRSPAMKTAFAIMDNFTRKAYGELTPELRRQSLDIMLEHRLNPDDISRYHPPRTDDLLYARERGMNAFNILNLVPEPDGEPLWVCYSPLTAYGPDFNGRLAARLDPVVRELRKHGLAGMAYVYGFDERGEDYDETIRGICHFVKTRYPEIHTFTTAGYMYEKQVESESPIDDGMDWYCPLTPRYDPEASRRLRDHGRQVWWYVCCGPKHPYANVASMDYPSIEGRLLGWMTYGYESDGLLFWHVNYWGNNTPIETLDPYLDWQPTCISRMTGDGALVYPHAEGLLSSIRLENVRDGIEDYDYLALLEQACGRDAAMAAFGRLVSSMTEFSRDPALLEEVRRDMARQIVRASR